MMRLLPVLDSVSMSAGIGVVRGNSRSPPYGNSMKPQLASASAGALHQSLRAATRSDHMNLDHMMLRLDLGRADDYGLFLNMHYAALQDLKADWREEDRDDFSLMMRCLQNDLHVLGLTAPSLFAATRTPLTAPGRLGAAYVVRGSRLGAAFLRKRVPGNLIASYLEVRPALTWPNFLLQLDSASSASGWNANDEVIRGAQATFGVFSARLVEALAVGP